MHAAIVGAFHLQVAPHAEAKILRYYRFYRFLGPLAQPPPPDGRHVARCDKVLVDTSSTAAAAPCRPPGCRAAAERPGMRRDSVHGVDSSTLSLLGFVLRALFNVSRASSLATAFELCGLDVLRARHVFEGQYLWIEGRPASGLIRAHKNVGDVINVAKRFSAFEGRMAAQWRAAV